MNGFRRKAFCLLLSAAMLLGSCAAAEKTFATYREALNFAKENHPQELDLGDVTWEARYLASILDAMGEGAVLHFRSRDYGTEISDMMTEVNMNRAKNRVMAEDIIQIIRLCPQLRKIDVSRVCYIGNRRMIELTEAYPEIEIVFTLNLRGYHSIRSNVTAYSAFSGQSKPDKIRSKDLEILRYVPNLKALDIGHCEITSLDWLQYCPDLELLILGDNPGITDLTPIGNLKHLKYLELFSTGAEDISCLAGCTELLDLNLSYCSRVTDLSALDSLTKLERFWGNHMGGLTGWDMRRFRMKHPETEVMFDGAHATSETWRTHERYSHYIWCLGTGNWIPFDEPLPEGAGGGNR